MAIKPNAQHLLRKQMLQFRFIFIMCGKKKFFFFVFKGLWLTKLSHNLKDRKKKKEEKEGKDKSSDVYTHRIVL